MQMLGGGVTDLTATSCTARWAQHAARLAGSVTLCPCTQNYALTRIAVAQQCPCIVTALAVPLSAMHTIVFLFCFQGFAYV